MRKASARPFDLPSSSPSVPESSSSARQGEIETDETIERPRERDDAQDPFAGWPHRQIGMEIIDKRHHPHAPMPVIVVATTAEFATGIGIENEMIESQLVWLPGRWICARAKSDYRLARFDREISGPGLRNQRFGAFGEGREVKRRLTRFAISVELRVQAPVQFCSEGEQRTGQANDNQEHGHQQAGS